MEVIGLEQNAHLQSNQAKVKRMKQEDGDLGRKSISVVSRSIVSR